MTDNFDAIKDFLTPKEIIVEEIDTNHSKIILEPLEKSPYSAVSDIECLIHSNPPSYIKSTINLTS